MDYRTQIALLRALKKGAKGLNAGLRATPKKGTQQPKKGDACRKCPKMSRRKR